MASPSAPSRQDTPAVNGGHLPVDPLIAPERPPAQSLDGTWVRPGEIEAAAELSRVARRLGLGKAGVNGFHLYGAYARIRSAAVRTERFLAGIRRRTEQR